jgi:hypothetical protein
MESSLIRFIAEPVQVEYDQPAGLEKKPECPDRFIWNGDRYAIVELVSEWHDDRRRGRMARNMRPEHAATASRRGSIGVGTFFFRVRTEEGRVFDLYYDRAPKDADHRKGEWLLFQELVIP